MIRETSVAPSINAQIAVILFMFLLAYAMPDLVAWAKGWL